MSYKLHCDLRRWTYSAVFCYSRGCMCEGCQYKRIMETQCLMKETVMELVRVFGAPTRYDYERVGLSYEGFKTRQQPISGMSIKEALQNEGEGRCNG